METKNFYDGLLIKTNDSHKTGCSDCTLCCFSNSDAECEDCPLKRGFYFEDPLVGDNMTDDDKKILLRVAQDLRFLVRHIESSIATSTFHVTTMELCKTYLNCSLADLSYVKTLDS